MSGWYYGSNSKQNLADWLEVEEYVERDRNSSGFKSCYQEDDYTSTVNASASMGLVREG